MHLLGSTFSGGIVHISYTFVASGRCVCGFESKQKAVCRMLIKEFVTQCNSLAQWCVFFIIWTPMEHFGTEEEHTRLWVQTQHLS